MNYLGTSTQQVTASGFDGYRRLSSIQDSIGGSTPSSFSFEWDAVGQLLKE